MNKKMHMAYPATSWKDAAVCGNGKIGAAVFGAVNRERILINHEKLYRYVAAPNLPDVSDLTDEFREQLLGGDYASAGDFIKEKLSRRGCVSSEKAPYLPFMEIFINYYPPVGFCDYKNEVDFESGIVTTSWSEGDCRFSRRVFVSRVSDTVVVEMCADKAGRISAEFGLQLVGGDFGKNYVSESDSTSDGDMIRFHAVGRDGVHYGALSRVVVRGGSTLTYNNVVKAENADSVLMLTKLFIFENEDDAFPRLEKEITALGEKFSPLAAEHSAAHRALYCTASFELEGANSDASNEELLLNAYGGRASDALICRLFDLGRYLLLCSAGETPPNLQGIWNGDWEPMWESDYHNDENIQMNYWAALPAALPETVASYVRYYESFMDDYRMEARRIFGCRGIYIPLAQTVDGKAYRDSPEVWYYWTGAAAWIGQLFYDYWHFTGDDDFLAAHTVPFLREVAVFYEDFLFEKDGKYVFCPSMSPENVPKTEKASIITVNATMDVALAKEAIGNLIFSCRHLGIQEDDCQRWEEMLSKLPEYKINEDGALCEWLWEGLGDNYDHRHQSHLYPLFPGIEITEETSPELYKACAVAVEKRLTVGLFMQTGWSFAHMANIYARLGMGEAAVECIDLMCRSTVGTNLFTYHNDWRDMGITMNWFGGTKVFQIDANLGTVSAVCEMLLFSDGKIIKPLPALPDSWRVGAYSGLRARGGVTVDARWSDKKAEITLRAMRDHTEFRLKLPFGKTECTVDGEARGGRYIDICITDSEKPCVVNV